MRLARIVLMPLLVVLIAGGCAERRPSIDWSSRVGKYTYDQAVQELGVPDKTAQLTDATRVAEWQLRSDGPSVIDSGPNFFGEPFWGGPQIVTVYPSSPNAGKWLRLIFGPDGQLKSWKSYHR